MSIFKRLSTTLLARVDTVVGELENHDALIQVTLKEQQKRIASAKLQLAKIQAASAEQNRQLAELVVDEKRWKERAIKEASTGNEESKALYCLQRRQDVQARIAKAELIRQKYDATAKGIADNIHAGEETLKSMIHKHELMRARQCSADVSSIIQRDGQTNLDELNSSFDRWEIKLMQNEFISANPETTDLLEQAYVNEETQNSLRKELAQLLNEQHGENNNANA